MLRGSDFPRLRYAAVQAATAHSSSGTMPDERRDSRRCSQLEALRRAPGREYEWTVGLAQVAEVSCSSVPSRSLESGGEDVAIGATGDTLLRARGDHPSPSVRASLSVLAAARNRTRARGRPSDHRRRVKRAARNQDAIDWRFSPGTGHAPPCSVLFSPRPPVSIDGNHWYGLTLSFDNCEPVGLAPRPLPFCW